MEQNKTGKYLKYAIGEIVLVVIGILIALSINNWNENRKTRNAELQLLEVMLEDLDRDNRVNTNYGMNLAKSIEVLHLSLYKESRDPSLIKDSLNVDLIRKGLAFSSVFYQRHSENTMLVSRNSLREELGNYLFRIEIATQAQNKQLNYLDNYLKPYFAKLGAHRLDAMLDANGYISSGRANFVDYEKLKDQYGTTAFDEHLFALTIRNSWFIECLQNVINKNHQLQAEIKTEIDLRK